MAQKLNFADALERLNDGYSVRASEVQSRALQRFVWVAEWHIPGCLSESQAYCLTKGDAIESALSMAAGSEGAPRGMKRDLIRYGMSDRVSPDAYVRMAITTVSRVCLSDLL